MKTFVVIGMGRFGQETAQRLYALGNEVLAIDESEESIQNISDKVTYAVVADAQNIEALRNLGVKNYENAVVAIGSDLAASIVITMNLKELGVKKVICKAQSEQHKTALERIGADRVMIPEKVIAAKLAESLSSENVLDYITLSDDYSIAELAVPSKWVGSTLAQLNVRTKHHLAVLAIKREHSMIVSPGGDALMMQGDIVLALGGNDALEKIKLL